MNSNSYSFNLETRLFYNYPVDIMILVDCSNQSETLCNYFMRNMQMPNNCYKLYCHRVTVHGLKTNTIMLVVKTTLVMRAKLVMQTCNLEILF